MLRRRAVRPGGYGLTSPGEFGSGIRTWQIHASTQLLIDVRLGGRLVTIPIGRNEMCSAISDKLDLDLDQCYLMLGSKPLQWGCSIGNYDISERCIIQVLPIMSGGGAFFVLFVLILLCRF